MNKSNVCNKQTRWKNISIETPKSVILYFKSYALNTAPDRDYHKNH